MFKMRCLVCGSTHTKKNGVRKGVQLYKCQDCGYQFRSGTEVSEAELWDAYQQKKHSKACCLLAAVSLAALNCISIRASSYKSTVGSLIAWS